VRDIITRKSKARRQGYEGSNEEAAKGEGCGWGFEASVLVHTANEP
jgi:hypothetical protein